MQVLIHNILYHLNIGYAGMVVYVRPNTLKFFYASQTLQNLVKQGMAHSACMRYTFDVLLHRQGGVGAVDSPRQPGRFPWRLL